MKILLLPFVFKKYFSSNKRVSGIDESMLRQRDGLKTLGNDVKVILGYSDIKEKDFFVFSRDVPTPELFKQQKSAIYKFVLEKIKEYDPDVILSNHYYNKTFYRFLEMTEKPVFLLSHSLPGTPADIHCAESLTRFLQLGHSFGCVSEFHRDKSDKCYATPRTSWKGLDINIKADHVVPSTYSVKCDIVPHNEKTIRHVSACNPNKGTFLPHAMCKETNFESEIFTTLNYIGGNKETEYYDTNSKMFENVSNCITNYDIPHSEIMTRISDSLGFFVGYSQRDTFAITAIEALQRGIPLLITGRNHIHPANNFVEPDFRQYVSYFTTKKQFLEIVKRYSSMSKSDRQNLADSCLRVMGIEQFAKKYESALLETIKKFNSTEKTSLEQFF